jgi:hypothetical protein
MTTEDAIGTAVGRWLRAAVEDAERRGLPELTPLIEGLAESTIALRKADWNDGVPVEPGPSGGDPRHAPTPVRPGGDGSR